MIKKMYLIKLCILFITTVFLPCSMTAGSAIAAEEDYCKPTVVVIPMSSSKATGDAEAGDVLESKTFSNGSEVGVSGTMANIGTQNITPTTSVQTITAGYHDGSGTVEGDSDLTASNIATGITIFGVNGSALVATGDATADQVLTGTTFSNGSGVGVSGTMADIGAQNITPTTVDLPITAGYHNGSGTVDGDSDLVEANIRDGIQIFGVTGTLPVGGSAAVPKTGQTAMVLLNSTPTGSDADLTKGVAWPIPRFTDNSDGTVTDNLTGLVWLKDADCFGSQDWATALTDSNALEDGACGLNDSSSAGDWRLPNVLELQSLIAWQYTGPALSNTVGNDEWSAGNAFTDVQYVSSASYWSSSTCADNTDQAWGLRPSSGLLIQYIKSVNSYHIWPVRD